MKKLIISILALTIMASCNDAGDSVEPAHYGQQEIKLTAGITQMEVTSKAAINETSFTTGTTIGLYAMQEGTNEKIWETGTPEYTNDGTATITSNNIAIVDKENHDKKFYYPTNGKTIQFFACYPTGIPEVYAASTTPTVKFDLSQADQPDIMYAKATSETLNTQTSGSIVALNFEHKLAKIAFKVKAGEGFPATGISISKLEIKKVNTDVSLNMGTGELTYTTEGTITYNLDQAIGTQESTVIGSTLLQAEAHYDLTVTAGNVTYTLTNLQTPAMGKAQNIVLTFLGTEIKATASITKWDDLADDNQDISK